MGNGQRFQVVIAGAGVAGLEAALALGELAGDAVQTKILSAKHSFSYRPLTVLEPFTGEQAPRVPVNDIAQLAGAEVIFDAFRWVDAPNRTVHTDSGQELSYDALILALGARRYAQLPYVLTLNPDALGTQFGTLVREVEHGLVKRITLIVPEGKSWPLPIYELAMMLAARANQSRNEVEITLVTVEQAPLRMFGEQASRIVESLLESSGVSVVCGTAAQVHSPHWVALGGGGSQHYADRIVALPELCGPSAPGVPTDARRGFVSIDNHSRVPRLDCVFAAGDMTASSVKHGGLGSQQADAAAEQIAVMAGAREQAQPCPGIVDAVLIGSAEPLYIRAHMVGGTVTHTEVSREALWENPQKLHARYLSPALAQLAAAGTPI